MNRAQARSLYALLFLSALLCSCVVMNRSVVISQPSEQNDNMLSTFAEGTKAPSQISGISLEAGKTLDTNSAVSTSSGSASADMKPQQPEAAEADKEQPTAPETSEDKSQAEDKKATEEPVEKAVEKPDSAAEPAADAPVAKEGD